MIRWHWLLVAVLLGFSLAGAQTQAPPVLPAAQCIECHTQTSPKVVSEWQQSKHSQAKVDCIACHGSDHTSAADVNNVKIARPTVCAPCHQAQVDQYRRGKHSHALAAMKTQPNVHWRSMAGSGQDDCATCHGVGAPATTIELRREKFGGIASGALKWGGGACSSCHARHTFSAEEAQQPKACEGCHNGPDAAQWQMYTSSKHGVLYESKDSKPLPPGVKPPTCQTCHMPSGDHEVRTAWGYWGVSLPLPDDPQWAADRRELLKALNMFGPQGQPTMLVDTLKANDGLRFSREDWQRERDKMIKICVGCHAEEFSRQQLQAGDNTIRAADHLLAEALKVVSGLYQEDVLQGPQQQRNYPWLTSFDEPKTAIEQRLQKMYLEHRMQTFHGSFHSSTKHVEGGLDELQADLVEIKRLAADLRQAHPHGGIRRGSTPTVPKPKSK